MGLVRRSLGHMLSALPNSERTPPFYYVVAWIWSRVFGTGEVGLRSLSAVFGTLTVLLAYVIARPIAGERAGLIAASLTAVSPILVWYSQEARSYELLVFFVLRRSGCGYERRRPHRRRGSSLGPPSRVSLWSRIISVPKGFLLGAVLPDGARPSDLGTPDRDHAQLRSRSVPHLRPHRRFLRRPQRRGTGGGSRWLPAAAETASAAAWTRLPDRRSRRSSEAVVRSLHRSTSRRDRCQAHPRTDRRLTSVSGPVWTVDTRRHVR